MKSKIAEEDLPLNPEFEAVLRSRYLAVVNGVAKTYTTAEVKERLFKRRKKA